MKNIILITKREFLTQVKKKSFIILTLLAPLLIVGFGALIALMFKANKTSHTFNIIDKSGVFTDKLKSNDDLKYIYVPENSEASLKASLKEMEGIDGLLIIPKLENNDFDKLEKDTKLLVNKKIGFETKNTVANNLEKIIRNEKIKNLGLEESQIKNLNKKFTLNTENIIDQKQEDNDLIFSVKYGLSMILMYVIFMFIIIYGVRVMRSVLEEK
ncbi:MAG: ABC transporter permease, partial [Cruoricaptor ignavus]|nr:ABC transporter permease [Cruoricaptor ignavus]